MERMTREEMADFLRNMKARQAALKEEKGQLLGSVETLEEAIKRNSFARMDSDGSGFQGFNPDKVLKVLLDSQRDIEEETRYMAKRMHFIYEMEDQIDYVEDCLFRLEEAERKLLMEAYVKGGVIDQMADKFGYSRSYFYKKLNRTLDKLVSVYNKNCRTALYMKADRLLKELLPYMPEGSFA